MHTVAATAPHDVLLGLAVGEGTGPELASVFEEAVAAFARAADLAVTVSRAPGLYRTFGGVLAAGLDAAAVERSSDEDVERYQTWVKTVHARGARAIFRTAFNAQPLYVVRERLACVKVETLPNGDGEILLVRDQTQGFYGGQNDRDGSADRITRTTTFSRAHTYRVLDFAVAEATRRFGGRDRIGPVVMAYKFHLLDLRFANWVADYARERGVDVRVYQPDTMNRNLLRGAWRGNAVVVGGNEWGDIMHADLLARAGCANQDERCSENVYLAPELAGLVEYQTVHGSADDIAGKDLVNPTATLRAVAHIFEHQLGVPGLVAALESSLRDGSTRTPDVGGAHGTRAVAAHLVERTVDLWRRPPPTPSLPGTALVVVDTQRDLLADDGRFPRSASSIRRASPTSCAGSRRPSKARAPTACRSSSCAPTATRTASPTTSRAATSAPAAAATSPPAPTARPSSASPRARPIRS